MPSLGKLADVVATYDPKPGLHFHLSCYVSRASTRASEWEGWATFSHIFQQRPSDFRYAVARQVVLSIENNRIETSLDNEWVCWDLYHTTLAGGVSTRTGALLRPPEPIWTGPNEDALIMKAMALYDRA